MKKLLQAEVLLLDTLDTRTLVGNLSGEQWASALNPCGYRILQACSS